MYSRLVVKSRILSLCVIVEDFFDLVSDLNPGYIQVIDERAVRTCRGNHACHLQFRPDLRKGKRMRRHIDLRHDFYAVRSLLLNKASKVLFGDRVVLRCR